MLWVILTVRFATMLPPPISERGSREGKSSEFRSLMLLFVAFGQERIDNIRHAVADLPAELHPYYRFATFEEAKADFLGPVWKSRSPGDEERYTLVRH